MSCSISFWYYEIFWLKQDIFFLDDIFSEEWQPWIWEGDDPHPPIRNKWNWISLKKNNLIRAVKNQCTHKKGKSVVGVRMVWDGGRGVQSPKIDWYDIWMLPNVI